MRLRRIEEQPAELSRSAIIRRTEIQSGFAETIMSPIAARAQAAKLLETLSPADAIRQLVIEGFRQAMAEDAVFVAAKQLGLSI